MRRIQLARFAERWGMTPTEALTRVNTFDLQCAAEAALYDTKKALKDSDA